MLFSEGFASFFLPLSTENYLVLPSTPKVKTEEEAELKLKPRQQRVTCCSIGSPHQCCDCPHPLCHCKCVNCDYFKKHCPQVSVPLSFQCNFHLCRNSQRRSPSLLPLVDIFKFRFGVWIECLSSCHVFSPRLLILIVSLKFRLFNVDFWAFTTCRQFCENRYGKHTSFV